MKKEKKAYLIVAICSLISIVYSLLSHTILKLFKIHEIGGIVFEDNFVKEVVVTLLIGPLIETLIFQVLIFYIVKFIFYLFSKEDLIYHNFFMIIYISIAAVVFSLSHSYSNSYMLLMILPGFFLAYIFLKLKKQFRYPVFYTFLIHLNHNSFVLVYNKFMVDKFI